MKYKFLPVRWPKKRTLLKVVLGCLVGSALLALFILFAYPFLVIEIGVVLSGVVTAAVIGITALVGFGIYKGFKTILSLGFSKENTMKKEEGERDSWGFKWRKFFSRFFKTTPVSAKRDSSPFLSSSTTSLPVDHQPASSLDETGIPELPQLLSKQEALIISDDTHASLLSQALVKPPSLSSAQAEDNPVRSVPSPLLSQKPPVQDLSDAERKRLRQQAYQSENWYGVLEIEETASNQEIKQAYYRLALECHPDKTQEEGATAHFQQIALAYELLTDAEAREKYRYKDFMGSSSATREAHNREWAEWVESFMKKVDELIALQKAEAARWKAQKAELTERIIENLVQLIEVLAERKADYIAWNLQLDALEQTVKDQEARIRKLGKGVAAKLRKLEERNDQEASLRKLGNDMEARLRKLEEIVAQREKTKSSSPSCSKQKDTSLLVVPSPSETALTKPLFLSSACVKLFRRDVAPWWLNKKPSLRPEEADLFYHLPRVNCGL